MLLLRKPTHRHQHSQNFELVLSAAHESTTELQRNKDGESLRSWRIKCDDSAAGSISEIESRTCPDKCLSRYPPPVHKSRLPIRHALNVCEVSMSSSRESVHLTSPSTAVLVYYPSHVSASILAVVTH
jgi:hypothetical protein